MASRSHKTGRPVATQRNVGVAAITKNLADELGPKGVIVTAVHPGATRTERTDPKTEAQYAAVVAFLAAPLSVAVNGDAIPVGGGGGGTIHY